MAIFGDVNDNRVIPLLLLSGIIFMTGMYLIYFYKWIASIFCGSHSISKIHIQQELEIPFDSFHLDRNATTGRTAIHSQAPSAPQWELESTIVVFQQSIRPSSASPIHPHLHHSHHTVAAPISPPSAPSGSLKVASSTLSMNSINSLSPVSCSEGKDVLKY